jgi:hypothetical protein
MSESYVYVVTRNKRRVEDVNYLSLKDADSRAARLREVLKEWDPSDFKNVSISKTKKPNQIR